MGSGGSQTHALYTTAPTVDEMVDFLSEQETQSVENELPEDLGEAGAHHLEKFYELVEEIKGLQEGPAFHGLVEASDEDDELAWYAHLKHTDQLATQHLLNAVHHGLPVDTGSSLNDLKGQATTSALAELDEDQLQKIAKQQGFLYPELVGLNHKPEANHALVHWLNPHYLADLESKNKIQAKAQERFTQLCAGQTVAGKTLTDVDHSGYGTGTWAVTQDQYSAMCATLGQQADTFPSLPPSEQAQALAQLVDTENKIFTASIPGIDTASLSGSKAESTLQVDEVLGSIPVNSSHFKPALDTAQAQGNISAEQRQVLNGVAALQTVRASVPDGEKADITKVANDRIWELELAKDWHDTLLAPGGVVSFSEKGSMEIHPLVDGKTMDGNIVDFSHAAQNYFVAKKDVSAWLIHASDTSGLYQQISGVSEYGKPLTPDDLAKKFKTWAIGQEKSTLIQAAVALGMEETEASTKTQAKKFIAESWGKGGTPDLLNGGETTQPSSTPAKKPNPESSAVSTKPTTTAFKPAASEMTKTSFGGHHAKLLEALKHYSGTAADVPQPLDTKVVAGHDFGSGTSATGLGGVHSKSLHTGPDGSQWLFKPDKTGGGRAAAEAAASKVFQAAGVSTVPVYTTKIGGHTGAVQPMIKGATALAADPKSWTQADVDHVVRTHVAQWVMGDHDGHPGNILKTPSGGLVPIDGGQAFKHYGADKLSLDYHPNASFGAPRPAYQQAYQAAAKGGLAEGVKIKPAVAHPIIQKLESIPDSQWRAMLHTTAHHGAKHSQIGWVPHMRKRAAAQHKIPPEKVTSDQIAEAFLDHACERKNGLRNAFTDFFSTELKLPGADALKYGA